MKLTPEWYIEHGNQYYTICVLVKLGSASYTERYCLREDEISDRVIFEDTIRVMYNDVMSVIREL